MKDKVYTIPEENEIADDEDLDLQGDVMRGVDPHKLLESKPVFGHYLTIEPWSPDFSTTQPQPNEVTAWICLPGFPVTLYKRSLIIEICECIDPVARIDYQTDSGRRGRFARMAITLDINKPLISKILISERVQIVKYEALPHICFICEKYGHGSEMCPSTNINKQTVTPPPTVTPTPPKELSTDKE
ncbi:uncharacterized protein LOC120115752 [Hibiscus syriacus]|uniref:uncharacterized protein LOC120115752 n=1 Tax=Hibiscus syriacus TaxID=106335 RepID=UPI001924E528|nr:uncharacterized protein LOC120115752 [Hibiscus syriacus]